MLVKIISLFLVGMLILAMFGKLRAPKLRFKPAKKCAKCGRHKIGKGACPCETQG